MPCFDLLKGNLFLKQFFQNEIEHHTLSHAYILEGEEGTGRHTLAKLVAVSLAKTEEHRQKILNNNSVDVKEYGLPEDKKIFTVEPIRRMKADSQIMPNDLDFKFYILSNTECMNQQAQNAALKILEEPPKNTYFFLLCENAASLLPTVRSRAQILRMERFSPEEMEKLLLEEKEFQKKKENDPEYFEKVLRSSMGSYGKALKMLQKKESNQLKNKVDRILQLLDCEKKSEVLLGMEGMPSKRAEFQEVLEEVLLALRDILLLRCDGNPRLMLYFLKEEDGMKTGEHLTKSQLLCIYDKWSTLYNQTALNINIQNARLNMATELARILGL